MKSGAEFETGLARETELDPITSLGEQEVRMIAGWYRNYLIASKNAREESRSRAQRGVDRRENGYLDASANGYQGAAEDLKTVLNLLGQSRLARTIKQQVDRRSK